MRGHGGRNLEVDGRTNELGGSFERSGKGRDDVLNGGLKPGFKGKG